MVSTPEHPLGAYPNLTTSPIARSNQPEGQSIAKYTKFSRIYSLFLAKIDDF
jgi:hypothetical protein